MAKYLGIPLQVASGTTVTPTYGSPELVTNGDFATNSDWTEGAGWDIDEVNNRITRTAQSGTTSASQDVSFVSGKRYIITYTLDVSAGSFLIRLGGDGVLDTTARSVSNTYTEVVTASGNYTTLNLRALDGTFAGYISNVSVKEVPYVLGKEIVSSDYIPANFTAGNGWTLNGSSASRGVATSTDYLVPNVTSQLVDGKSYQVGFTLSNMSQANTAGISSTGAFGQVGTDLKFRSTNGSNLFNSVYDEDQSTSPDLRFVSGTNALTFTLSGITVKEVQYNYLQVVSGDFLKQCKVGDVVFNYSDDTEAVVLQVLDNNTLLLSNDILSDAGDAFFIFAPNGDTRGNQILRIDNYIMSEYDEATSVPIQSSFWFAAGPQADKVTLTQLNDAVNTYFVADVIERFVQRLNSQSATASRLDIPLNEFRDHKYNQLLVTIAITLS